MAKRPKPKPRPRPRPQPKKPGTYSRSIWVGPHGEIDPLDGLVLKLPLTLPKDIYEMSDSMKKRIAAFQTPVNYNDFHLY